MITNQPDENGERGVVINVSSGAAWQGQKGQAAYAASKAAVIGLMLPVARDLAPYGIRVVTVAPGLFRTGMSSSFTPELVAELETQILSPRRMGDPAEFAGDRSGRPGCDGCVRRRRSAGGRSRPLGGRGVGAPTEHTIQSPRPPPDLSA